VKKKAMCAVSPSSEEKKVAGILRYEEKNHEVHHGTLQPRYV
jgi:hypothetical protein